MQNANSTVAGTAATTAADTQIGIEEENARAFVFDTGTSLTEIVEAINNVGASAAIWLLFRSTEGSRFFACRVNNYLGHQYEWYSKFNKNYDLNLLLKNNKTKDVDRDLKEVAEKFESLFLNEMLKRANAAKLAKSILSNDEQETYTSLLNQEEQKLLLKVKVLELLKP